MKPAPFDYVAPHSLQEALSLLAEHEADAKPLAGGQSLVPAMNFRLARPALLVDLNGLAELDYIRQGEDGGLRIGAMTRQRRLERDPLVAERDPLLHETMPFVAHPQIRNRGTAGGSIAHADPAGELPVIAVARQMRFRLQAAGQERWVEAESFFEGLFATACRPNELVVEIAVPPLPANTGYAFMEMARRHGDYALAGVAVLLTVDASGICRQARIVCLNVGEVPVVAAGAAQMLVGEQPAPALFAAAAAKAASDEIDPAGDIHATTAYKRHLTGVLIRRALQQALARTNHAH